MTISVQTVAKFILQNSDRTSNLKLQKLLYYVQGWHLGFKGEPLFSEQIQAWMHGPVVPEVFREYRKFGWQIIEKPVQPLSMLPINAGHIKNVLAAYNKYSEYDLVRLSHSEQPWLLARTGIPEGESSTAEITHESMRDFFAQRARAQTR